MDYSQQDTRFTYWIAGNITALVVIPMGLWIAENGLQAVKEFQPLIGALIALAAAAIAYRSMRNQQRIADRALEDTQKARAEAKQRKQVASVAALPVALARINDYASECIALLVKIFPNDLVADVSKQKWNTDDSPPNLPSGEVIGIIKECIEHTDGDIARELGNILIRLNLQHVSLMNAYRDRRRDKFPHVLYSQSISAAYLYDALDIYARTGNMLIHLADEDSKILRMDLDIASVAVILNLNRTEFETRHTFIAQRYRSKHN